MQNLLSRPVSLRLVPLLTLFVACKPAPPAVPTPEPAPAAPDAAAFAKEVDAKLLQLYIASETAHWQLDTDITDEHEKAAAAADEQLMAYLSETIPQAAKLDLTNADPAVARQLKLLKTANPLPAPADPALRSELATIAARMPAMYGKGEWCKTPETCLDIGQIEEKISASRDPKEQIELVQGWQTVGVPMRADYTRFVELGNQGAKEIGFADVGELWRSGYDMAPAELEAEIDRLWGQLKPLYEQLHCNTRAKLSKKYGKKFVPESGPMPAELLGNLWAQDWSAVYDLVEPYPKEASLDVDQALAAQKWDDQKMTKTAEAFFVSVGLDPLPATFWERSMFVQPPDREVVCHASAWDPSWNDDLRIKMCIKPTQEDLVTLHHELGHLYYNHYYKAQPTLFRAGANDGFHEAIGDTIALSITPAYLKQVGLADEVSESEGAVVNQQMQVALERLAFLPFGLVIDRWRWEVFDGRIPADQYNTGWWRLRTELQGVAPSAPTGGLAPRGEEFFDPGAKYHVPGNTPYLRYFIAHVLEFQLHRALCKEAGWTGPLHACSIYGSKEAGAKLQALLTMGASKPWPDALEAATGERQLDAGAIVEYFQPLMGYLQEQNKGRTCGW